MNKFSISLTFIISTSCTKLIEKDTNNITQAYMSKNCGLLVSTQHKKNIHLTDT